jgi:4-amino-4-deoxy-L-arabinose transferase-like glycosyltransferase
MPVTHRAGAPVGRAHAHRWLLAAGAALFHAATARGYGYFRDELYYLACGEHLDFGYVDHPPLIGLVAAAVRATLGTSLPALRLLPALAAGAAVWLACALARELGGGRRAEILAGVATLVAPLYLSLFSFFSMNAFDVVFWAACWLPAARILKTGDDRLWIPFGLAAGAGLQNKISLLFLGAGLAAGLAAARRWDVLRSSRFWIGGAIAGAIFLPYVLWNAAHGWPTPEFMANARAFKIAAVGPPAFIGEVALLLGPGALPLVIAGLAFLLVSARGRPHRPLGWAAVAILVLMIASGSKAYYFGPAFTLLFAAGGVAVEGWTGRRGASLARGAVAALMAASGILAAPLGKPLLPVEAFVRYAAWLGPVPGAGERHRLGRLPQLFADMHGWPELAVAVAGVHRALPPEDRARACVFGQNYGQAGAIDLFGPEHGLPKAISGHNSYHLWGPRDCTGEVVLVIGDEKGRLEEFFESVEAGAVYTCRDCMPFEDGKTIWIARRLKGPLAEVWPAVKSFI